MAIACDFLQELEGKTPLLKTLHTSNTRDQRGYATDISYASAKAEQHSYPTAKPMCHHKGQRSKIDTS